MLVIVPATPQPAVRSLGLVAAPLGRSTKLTGTAGYRPDLHLRRISNMKVAVCAVLACTLGPCCSVSFAKHTAVPGLTIRSRAQAKAQPQLSCRLASAIH